jgi:prepilin peptidase CpaA
MALVEAWKWGIAPVLLVALVTDWRWHKIYNWLTFPAMALGLVVPVAVGSVSGGPWGALNAALASVLGFFAFPMIHMVLARLIQPGGFAAGDVKLTAAVGAWLGWPLMMDALLYSAVAGGILSLAWAAGHGVLKDMVVAVRDYFVRFQAGIGGPLQKSTAPPFPYGVSIVAGTLAAMYWPGLIGIPPLPVFGR